MQLFKRAHDIRTKSDVFPGVGDWFAADQVQQSFQVGKSICLLPGDKMKPPSVPSHQIDDDNFTANLQWQLVL